MAKLTELWSIAYKAEVGISISTDNRPLLRQHLYQARAEANDPKLDNLALILPETPDEVWIVHRNANEAPDEYDQ